MDWKMKVQLNSLSIQKAKHTLRTLGDKMQEIACLLLDIQ